MIPLYSQLPSIDLHGYDRDYARILINEFIYDQYKLKQESIIIVHGNGSGILKRMTQDVLKKNKYVIDYRLFYNNVGMTLVKINIDK